MLLQNVSLYLEYLEVERGLAKNTVESYRGDLYSLCAFLQTLDVTQSDAVNRVHLNMYIKNLHDKNYTPFSIARQIASIKGFFKWLCVCSVIQNNPALAIEQPKLPKRLQIIFYCPSVQTISGLKKISPGKLKKLTNILQITKSSWVRRLIILKKLSLKQNGMMNCVTIQKHLFCRVRIRQE